MERKEKDLVRRAAQGDRSAMADLYNRNIRYLTAVCSRYIQNDDDRNDILQTSFVKIFSSLGSFVYRGEGSIKAWMSRIVVNEALNYLKSKTKDWKADERDLLGIPAEEDETPNVEDIPQAVIQEMIRQLPDGYRTVFNLFVFEEKSHREIAGLLGISESTSASQFHRARSILAKKIQEYRKSIE